MLENHQNFKPSKRQFVSGLYRKLPIGFVALVDFLRSYHQCLYRDIPIFVHVPKNGGTSVATSLYGKRILHVKVSSLNKFLKIFHLSNRTIFGLYRDPIDRFVSACNFLSHGGTSTVAMDYKNYYQNYDFESLDSFIQMLTDIEHCKLDYVFQRQSEFLSSDFKIFSIDDIQDLQSLGIPINTRFDKINSSVKKFMVEDLSAEQNFFLRDYYEQDYLFDNVVKRHGGALL